MVEMREPRKPPRMPPKYEIPEEDNDDISPGWLLVLALVGLASWALWWWVQR